MELFHTGGSLTVNPDVVYVGMTPNITLIRMGLNLRPKEQLKLCKLMIPISANFFMKSCEVIVNGEELTAKIVRRDGAVALFEEETASSSIVAKMHRDLDSVLIEIGNVADLKLKVTLLGTQRIFPSVLNSKEVTMEVHVPFGKRPKPYGREPSVEDEVIKGSAKSDYDFKEFKVKLCEFTSEARCRSSTHVISSTCHENTFEILSLVEDESCIRSKNDYNGLILLVDMIPNDGSLMVQPDSKVFENKKIILLSSCIPLSGQEVGYRERLCKEVIFMVDCSNSMRNKLPVTKLCLQLAVKNLPVGNKFNILCFGNKPRYAFRESLDHTDFNVYKAYSFIEDMKADMGGTEVGSAINHVKTIPPQEDLKRTVILITDGYTYNVEHCGFLASQSLDVEQWNGIGIGEEASSALLKSVTQHCEGTYRMLSSKVSKEHILEVITSQLCFSLIPSVKCNVTIRSPRRQDTIVLIEAPVLIRHMMPFKLMVAAEKDDKTLEVNIYTNAKKYTNSVNLTRPGTVCNDLPETMAANSLLQFYSMMNRPSNNKKARLAQSAVSFLLPDRSPESLIDLSIRANVLCKGTSLMVVKRKDESFQHDKWVASNQEERDTYLRGNRMSSEFIVVLNGNKIRPVDHSPKLSSIGCMGSRVCCDGSDLSTSPDSCVLHKGPGSETSVGKSLNCAVEATTCKNESLGSAVVNTISCAGGWTTRSLPVKYYALPKGLVKVIDREEDLEEVWCTLLVLFKLQGSIQVRPLSVQLAYSKAVRLVESLLKAPLVGDTVDFFKEMIH